MNSENARLCRRCLLEDMDDQRSLYELIRDYVSSLPEGIRTGESEYRRRLALCRECAFLLGGTCQKCGCYAEARAAKKAMHCPDPAPKW